MPAVLIGQLVKESVEEPEKIEGVRAKLQLIQQKKQAIEDTTTNMLAKNIAIVGVQQIQKAVEDDAGFDVALPHIRQVLKKEMRMGYRKSGVVPIQSNLPRCLVLR